MKAPPDPAVIRRLDYERATLGGAIGALSRLARGLRTLLGARMLLRLNEAIGQQLVRLQARSRFDDETEHLLLQALCPEPAIRADNQAASLYLDALRQELAALTDFNQPATDYERYRELEKRCYEAHELTKLHLKQLRGF
jgi:hypothetical protein